MCQNGSSANYFRLTFVNRDVPADPDHAPAEIDFFMHRAAGALGATATASGQAQSHDLFWHLGHLGGAKATQTVRVWFSGPRIEARVKALTPDLIEHVFTERLQYLRGSKELPAFAKANPQSALANSLLDQWNRASSVPNRDNGSNMSEKDRIGLQYWNLFHFKAATDYEHREELRFGIDLGMRLKTMPIESYADAFAELGQRDGLHVWTHMGTFVQMVGGDETYIETFELKGNGIDVVAKDSAVPTVKGFDAARDELTVPQ
jgi:hypothetical protein